MIAFHEARVFEAVNRLEEELKKAALAMLEVFDELCGALRALPPGADPAAAVKAALTFPKLLHAYLTAFQAWKRPDEAKLTERIKHALSALSTSSTLHLCLLANVVTSSIILGGESALRLRARSASAATISA